MATSRELVPVSTELEDEAAKLADRREIMYSMRSGLEIIQYWLRSSNTIRMVLIEEGFEPREFPIPNDQVIEAQFHPEVYANLAGKNREITRPYEGSA